MQSYDLFKDLIGYIPNELSFVQNFFYSVLPYLLMICALFTAYFGLKCAVIWCSLTFAFLGTTTAASVLLPKLDLTDFHYWFLLAICLIIGIICGCFSKYLSRIQLIMSTFFLVYAALPSEIKYLGDVASNTVSIIVGLALVFLTVKYKYIVTIATTSFSGSFIFWNVIDDMYSAKPKTLYAILMGFTAFVFQCLVCKEQLKETYKDVRKKLKKTKEDGTKMVNFVDKEITKFLPSEEKFEEEAETLKNKIIGHKKDEAEPAFDRQGDETEHKA